MPYIELYHILNYNLVPYLNKKHLQECLKTPKGAVIDIKRENIYIYLFYKYPLCHLVAC